MHQALAKDPDHTGVDEALAHRCDRHLVDRGDLLDLVLELLLGVLEAGLAEEGLEGHLVADAQRGLAGDVGLYLLDGELGGLQVVLHRHALVLQRVKELLRHGVGAGGHQLAGDVPDEALGERRARGSFDETSAGGRLVLVETRADVVAQLGHRLEAADVGGQFVVEGGQALRLDLEDLDVERGRLVDVLGVGRRLGDVELDVALVAGLGADQALFELGRHDAAPDLVEVLVDGEVLGGLAVDGAREGQEREVAVGDAAVLDDLEGREAVAEVVDLSVDLGVGGVRQRDLGLEVLDRGDGVVGTDVDLGGVGVVHTLLDQVEVTGVGRAHGTEALLVERTRVAALDQVLERLGQNGLAAYVGVDQRTRGLAGAEARQLDLARDARVGVGDGLVDLRSGVRDGQPDAVAFELLNGRVQGSSCYVSFGGLLVRRRTVRLIQGGPAPEFRWCGREDLNLHESPHRDLNPARLPIPPRPRAVNHYTAKRRTPHAGLSGRKMGSAFPPRLRVTAVSAAPGPAAGVEARPPRGGYGEPRPGVGAPFIEEEP